MTFGKAAQALAFRGWPVFPCEPRGKKPLTPHGFKDATTDPERIAAWWCRWPEANIGFRTGALVVVEIDGREGMRARAELEAQGLDWPVTLAAMTGRRPGMHYYFRPPEGVRIANAVGVRGARGLGPGIDVRGDGGYVIVPPSVHPTGRRYAWAVREEATPLPAWMVERLRPPRPIREPVLRGDSAVYAHVALEGECAEVESATLGTLNDTLNRSAFKLGLLVARGAIAADDVREALLAAALRNGHPERGARRTIDSGLSAGIARGR